MLLHLPPTIFVYPTLFISYLTRVNPNQEKSLTTQRFISCTLVHEPA